jgi:hypothetical protein
MSYADTDVQDDPMNRLVDASQEEKSEFTRAQDADAKRSANVDFRLGAAMRCMQKIQAKIASNVSSDDLSGACNASSDNLRDASSAMPQETIKIVPNTCTTRVIYEIDKPGNDLFSIEVDTIMSRAFPIAIKPGMSNKKKIESLLYYSGYFVLKIEKVDNLSQKIRFEAEKIASGIEESTIVFHGTSEDNIDGVLCESFNFRKLERGMYGVGYYSSESSWEALKYAKPNEQDKIQFLIVFEYLKGSTAIGSKGQTDFGTNLTLTNETGKILCAKNHTQFNPKYVITMQYDMNNVLTRLQNSTVENFHKVIYDMIISKKSAASALVSASTSISASTSASTSAGSFLVGSSSATPGSSSAVAGSSSAVAGSSSAVAGSSSVPAGSSSAVAGSSSAVAANTRQKHEVLNELLINKQKIAKGTKVMVIDAFNPRIFYFAKGYEGVVMKIVKKYNKYIYVEISDPKIKEQVINANKMLKTKNEFPFTIDQEESWIVLPPRYIKIISSSGAGADAGAGAGAGVSGTSASGTAGAGVSAGVGAGGGAGASASGSSSGSSSGTSSGATVVAILEAATAAALAARSTYIADLQKLATANSSGTGPSVATGPSAVATGSSAARSGLRRELAIIIPDTDFKAPITNKRCIDLVNENDDVSTEASTGASAGTNKKQKP